RFAETSLCGGEAFLDWFVIQSKERLPFLHLRAFGKQHFIDERLDARADFNVLRRIQLADKFGGGGGIRRSNLHYFDGGWWRWSSSFFFATGETVRRAEKKKQRENNGSISKRLAIIEPERSAR